MPFAYERTIHLAETDAAGLVYFGNYLTFCHEAYEEALAAAGLPLREFFAETDVIVPISRSTVEYLRPLQCNDRVRIALQVARLSDHSFAIDYELTRLGTPPKVAARARTEHVATSRSRRTRTPLPPKLAAWVDAG
ncbi:MAG: acyl-CoA thioesterase [Opitutales bacterium]